MDKNLSHRPVFLILVFVLACSPLGRAQGSFEILSGTRLKRAMPRDFYLEGTAFPVEKRNALLIETPSGARVLLALVVTSGYASQLPHKYSGMLISEGLLSVCGHPLRVGSYGFGVHRPATLRSGDAEFVLYNQAGEEIWKCVSRRDAGLKDPRPLQAILGTPSSARIYLGRYWVGLKSITKGGK